MASAPSVRRRACVSSSFKLAGWYSARPRSCASAFTALGTSLSPRPAGLSGWVSTSAMSCPARASAARARAANSGVPAKIRRIGAEAAGELRALALLLLQLGANAGLLQPRQVFDEHPALQVVHLVLDANGEHALGVHGKSPAVQPQRAHGDTLGARDSLVTAGQRQASLFAIGHAAGGEDFRIDQRQKFIARFRCIDDN